MVDLEQPSGSFPSGLPAITRNDSFFSKIAITLDGTSSIVKVGINLLYLLRRQAGGSETYAVCLLEALSKLASPFEFTVYLNRESSELPLSKSPRKRSVVSPVKRKWT